jgi:hypothetical protein
VLLCFDCDAVGLFVGDDALVQSSKARAQLVPLVKEIFPKNPDIQRLSAKEEP